MHVHGLLEDHFLFCKYFKLYCEIAPWVNKVIIIITRSYYRKESAASPPWDQRQHAEFAE
jgi:hypothetical protein